MGINFRFNAMRVIAGLILFLLPAWGWACRGPDSETCTFLPKLPAEAMSRAVVAKVRIQSREVDQRRTMSRVEVVEALKGVNKGEIVIVETAGAIRSSCDRDPAPEASWWKSWMWLLGGQREYYIAGVMDQQGVFRGEWNGVCF